MNKIKLLVVSLLFAAFAIPSALAQRTYPVQLPPRSPDEMKEPVTGIYKDWPWIGTNYTNVGADNMGNPTTFRIPILSRTYAMYFSSIYPLAYTLRGNGRTAYATSSITVTPSGKKFFDAFVAGNNISAMIESDGCVELSYLYLPYKDPDFYPWYPGPFVIVTAGYSMFVEK